MNRREFIATALALPVVMTHPSPPLTFREVERFVVQPGILHGCAADRCLAVDWPRKQPFYRTGCPCGTWTRIEFHDLKSGDLWRFADDPPHHVWLATSDPSPCDPPGNWVIEAGFDGAMPNWWSRIDPDLLYA